MLAPLSLNAQGNENAYYYANGERIPLTVSAEYVAAQFTTATAAQQAQTQVAELADGAPVYDSGTITGDEFVMLETSSSIDSETAVQAADTLESSRNLGVNWANPVYELGDYDLVVSDEFIAGFAPGTARSVVDDYNRRNGVEVVNLLMNDVYLLRVTPASGISALAMANRYEEEDVAAYGEPNFFILFERNFPQSDATETPVPETFAPANDPLYGNQWHLNNSGQYSGSTADADTDAQEAWDITPGSSSVIIAILDDGVQIGHPDLNDKIVAPFDAVTGDNDPSPFDTALTRDIDGHGTACAGLAAAESNNSSGVAGACQNCRLMPIRIFRTESTPTGNRLVGSTTITTNAINHAVNNGAAVLSNSWGQTPSTTVTNAFLNAATNGRGGLGAVVLVAAGNSYQSAISAPGNLANIFPGFITVGASNWCDQPKTPTTNACNAGLGWGNNWGAAVGLSAPGHTLATTDVTGTDGYVSGDYTTGFGGTSGATPIAAGIVGLLLSNEPTLTSDDVRQRLFTTANDIGNAGYDVASGWGRINVNAALLNQTSNSGISNDRWSAATSVPTLPYTTTQGVLGAFVTRDEPALCTLGANTVWYAYTPTYNQVINASTSGSNYDTVLGVFTGSPGSFTSVICNDDSAGTGSVSAVSFNASAGTTYYFVAAAWGGSNTLNAVGAPANASLTISISTTTPAPTSTPAPAATLTGTIALQGRTVGSAAMSVPLVVRYTPTGGTAQMILVNTDVNGVFTITDLMPGSYTIHVKHSQALAVSQTVTLTNGNNAVNFGTLPTGDVNNDNNVTLSDFSALAASFNLRTGDAGYNASADLNGDGTVSLADFSLLAGNFNQAGAQ
jgi:subtilisin family serine protease